MPLTRGVTISQEAAADEVLCGILYYRNAL